MAYRLKFVSQSAKEQRLFRSIHAILADHQAQWQIVSGDEKADVMLIDAAQLDRRQFYQACRDAVGALPVFYGEENRFNAHFFIQKPMKVAALAELLDALSQHLQGLQQPRSNNLSNRAAFKPEQHLLGLMLTAEKADGPVALVHGAFPAMVVDGRAQCFYMKTLDEQHFDGCYIQQLDNVPLQDVQLKPMEPELIQRLVRAQVLKPIPLHRILWEVTLACSHGDLLAGFHLGDKLKLHAWPALDHFKHRPMHSKLAAFLYQQSADILTIANKTETSVAKVIDFVNACALLGYLEVEKPLQPSLASVADSPAQTTGASVGWTRRLLEVVKPVSRSPH